MFLLSVGCPSILIADSNSIHLTVSNPPPEPPTIIQNRWNVWTIDILKFPSFVFRFWIFELWFSFLVFGVPFLVFEFVLFPYFRFKFCFHKYIVFSFPTQPGGPESEQSDGFWSGEKLKTLRKSIITTFFGIGLHIWFLRKIGII